ncbi:MAG: aminopeptidase P N-terminal domain-containing protein [Acidobacteriota bacterium]
MKRTLEIILLLITFEVVSMAQPVFTDIFPREEFAARRAKLLERIGDGVVVVQGTTERPGEQALRQNNQFFYLCGVIEPRAILVIDSRTRRSTLFLSGGAERRKRMYGEAMVPGEEAARVTGLDEVRAREDFGSVMSSILKAGRQIFTPHRAEVLGTASASDAVAHARATREDPWDGRPSREESFIQKLRDLSPAARIADLDPHLDYLRAFKSPREIALIREATRITGEGIMAAMRSAQPGRFEYELQAAAEHVFKRAGSQGPAYFALVATGRNTLYSHYHKNTTRLADGDLVQFDYAPDYKYYVSDVTRVFPANGHFTSRQREFYTIYLRLYQALLTSIRVHATPAEIIREAVGKMDRIMAEFSFTDTRIREAAGRFVERYRASRATSLGHTIGMEVHDVRIPTATLEPGQVFTIEPAMTIPEESLGIRLEDVILMTETGYENLSAFLPVEAAEIERLMVPPRPPVISSPAGSENVEQRTAGREPAPRLVRSFDGLGVGFRGPQGTATLRNPSDNSLAVGPSHVMQTVNTRLAIFTKEGKPVYGPVPNNTVFRGFGGPCEAINNGDTVVRYDQLANRWLIVMPTFRRGPARPDQPAIPKAGDAAQVSVAGRAGQPGAAVPLYVPSAAELASGSWLPRPIDPGQTGPYSMCYAISTGPDPMGPYYRYEFLRPLFPDYPRPAVWPDGYYVPTSTGDEVIQRHACVVEREKMLRGEPASEQCLILEGVNFLNNADVDGPAEPPRGAPNLMLASGGAQLKGIVEDDGIYAWNFRVDWRNPVRTRIDETRKITVAPYRYLCDGQLTDCVAQPGTTSRLDSQGDKIMARLVYRRSGKIESLVGVHSINTTAGTGGVRWYELRFNPDRSLRLHQQGTFAPDANWRWMASPAIDRFGNIGIGYSFGGATSFPGQRFAGRTATGPPGRLNLGETILVEGEAAQSGMRWQDYTQTAIDPQDDCTIWFVGDYLKREATAYTTRIGAFQLPGCRGRGR